VALMSFSTFHASWSAGWRPEPVIQRVPGDRQLDRGRLFGGRGVQDPCELECAEEGCMIVSRRSSFRRRGAGPGAGSPSLAPGHLNLWPPRGARKRSGMLRERLELTSKARQRKHLSIRIKANGELAKLQHLCW